MYSKMYTFCAWCVYHVGFRDSGLVKSLSQPASLARRDRLVRLHDDTQPQLQPDRVEEGLEQTSSTSEVEHPQAAR